MHENPRRVPDEVEVQLELDRGLVWQRAHDELHPYLLAEREACSSKLGNSGPSRCRVDCAIGLIVDVCVCVYERALSFAFLLPQLTRLEA